MANRLFDNVIVIDSAMGNLNAVGGTSANITNFNVKAVAFWSTDTTGNLIISGADTTNHILRLTNPNDDSTTVGILLNGLSLNTIKIPTLTAGTAWIYLS